MISIEKMTIKHIEQVLKIESDSFNSSWSKSTFVKEILENKLAHYFVAIKEGNVIGYIGTWYIINEVHITTIAVAKQFRRQKIGSYLIDNIIDYYKEKDVIGITLEVRVSNKIAIDLYKKKGFLLDGIRKEYYENKEDAYIMWKYFKKGAKNDRSSYF